MDTPLQSAETASDGMFRLADNAAAGTPIHPGDLQSILTSLMLACGSQAELVLDHLASEVRSDCEAASGALFEAAQLAKQVGELVQEARQALAATGVPAFRL